MKSRLWGAVSACVITFASLSADAALVSRLGGQAVYDTDLDITWLADANAGAGSAFENKANGFSPGQMNWVNANAWAASLTVGGFTDWRLPTTADPDASCTDDIAGAVPSADAIGVNCTGSEMGHLFYIELGATADTPVTTTGDPMELAKFTNIMTRDYWSSTEFPPDPLNPDSAWEFNTAHGSQGIGLKNGDLFAWAVRSGDVGVGAVPIPATVWLFGSGLIGLLSIAKRNHWHTCRGECPWNNQQLTDD